MFENVQAQHHIEQVALLTALYLYDQGRMTIDQVSKTVGVEGQRLLQNFAELRKTNEYKTWYPKVSQLSDEYYKINPGHRLFVQNEPGERMDRILGSLEDRQLDPELLLQHPLASQWLEQPSIRSICDTTLDNLRSNAYHELPHGKRLLAELRVLWNLQQALKGLSKYGDACLRAGREQDKQALLQHTRQQLSNYHLASKRYATLLKLKDICLVDDAARLLYHYESGRWDEFASTLHRCKDRLLPVELFMEELTAKGGKSAILEENIGLAPEAVEVLSTTSWFRQMVGNTLENVHPELMTSGQFLMAVGYARHKAPHMEADLQERVSDRCAAIIDAYKQQIAELQRLRETDPDYYRSQQFVQFYGESCEFLSLYPTTAELQEVSGYRHHLATQLEQQVARVENQDLHEQSAERDSFRRMYSQLDRLEQHVQGLGWNESHLALDEPLPQGLQLALLRLNERLAQLDEKQRKEAFDRINPGIVDAVQTDANRAEYMEHQKKLQSQEESPARQQKPKQA